VFLHEFVFGPIKIYQLDRAAGFDCRVERVVELEDVLELEEFPLFPGHIFWRAGRLSSSRRTSAAYRSH